MSMYTTGEIAKLCGVTVRTVQYYDSRNILEPSALSEGGRRLYSEEDLQRMKIICFLRDMDLSIKTISELFSEVHPEAVIEVLLNQQKTVLEEEIALRQKKLDTLRSMQREIRKIEDFSLQSIGDIAHIMENKHRLKHVRTVLLAVAIPLGGLEWTGILLWILSGIWQPFALYALLAIPCTIWLFRYYWREISYICPQCHKVFKPSKKEMFFAAHTATTRRLTCTCCGHKGFCVETYGGNENETV